MFLPILYTGLTTICAFLSLIFSGIRPVIDFGWMMTIGLVTSVITTFTLLPSLINILTEKIFLVLKVIMMSLKFQIFYLYFLKVIKN